MGKAVGSARYVELYEAKKHLLIEAAFTEDDGYIGDLIDAAELIVERDLCKPLATLVVDGALPNPIKYAIYLLISHMYENRSPVTFGATPHEVPQSYRALIERWINYAG